MPYDSGAETMSIIANAQSASALAQAQQAQAMAEKAMCVVTMKGYSDATATLEVKREYAGCVYTVYGDGKPIDPASALLLKIAVVVVLVSAVFGIGQAIKNREDFVDSVMFGFLYGCGAAFLLFVAAVVADVFGFI